MHRKKDGDVLGVLNDYDLAIFASNNHSPSSKTCTGTQPFMAIDLLGHPTDLHRYRHDLESLFYALVYVTARYHNDQEIEDPLLQDWDDLVEEALKSVKTRFLNDALPKRMPEFSPFIIWIAGFRAALRAGINARTEHEEQMEVATQATEYSHSALFHHETLGGHFSFDIFRQILAMNILDLWDHATFCYVYIMCMF
jgi:Fungal protein kinase